MDGDGERCQNCGTQRAIRRYCRACSPQASAFYKQEERRQAKAAGEKYWLDWWLKTYGDLAHEKRREYQAQYMRGYRQKLRTTSVKHSGSAPR